ncbi:MAG: hypothetical protein F4Y03_01150 [Alphaproteobacteria bacterium]|nr:hypothetical protein [Alphaproteobacteria bacterium]
MGYPDAPVPIRADILAAHARAWAWIAAPGNWLTGAERIAVADETRHALDCRLCAARKQALSPEAVAGEHDGPGVLEPPMVEIVHRIVTDPARLTRRWFEARRAEGVEVTRYVETVGVTAVTVSLDTFARSMGLPLRRLPEPQAGEPSGYLPASARMEEAWVPLIVPGEESGAEADLYAGTRGAYILMALTLVPEAKRAFFDLVETQYLPSRWMQAFDVEHRAISHAQIEFLAARISALNQCVY